MSLAAPAENRVLTKRRHLWVAALVCVLALALRLIAAAQTYPADDAFITYRYAANLAHGQGFVYNAGEHVQGTTTPLLTVLLALPGAAGLDVATVGVALCLALSAVAAALLFGLVRGQTGNLVAAGVATTWLVFSTHQNVLAASGMEATLLICLMLGSYALLARERPAPAMLLAGLAPLVRPEGVVWLALCGVALVVRQRRQAWLLGAALLPLVVWLAFAWFSFGSIIPQSVLAKRLQGGGPMAAGAEWLALLRPLGVPWLLAVLVGGGAVYAVRRDRLLLVPIAFSVIFVAAYLWAGPNPYPWYPGPLDGALAIIAGGVVGWAVGRLAGERRLAWAHVAPLAAIVLFCVLLYARADGLYGQMTAPRPMEMHRWLADWVHANTRPGDTVLVGDVGYVGYVNLDRRVYDHYRLVWRGPLSVSRATTPELWFHDALEALQPTVAITDMENAGPGGRYEPPGYRREPLAAGFVAYRRR